MNNHYAVDGGGVLRAASRAVALPALELPVTLKGLGRSDIRRRIEFGLLSLGALVIAGAYILVPLVTALYSLITTVVAALTLGIAIVTQLALLVVYVIGRTAAPQAATGIGRPETS